jgi:hypothetical protein
MVLLTKDSMERGSSGAIYEIFINYDAPGSRRPTGLLSVGTAFRWRPWPAALLIILSPSSVPLDVLVLSHVCLCLVEV